MARDKERSINPAQQQRKLEKQKQLKKSRAELQAKRNEKLARRNPDRLDRQIQDLQALEASGDIKPREKAILEELERDLKAVRKAREALGDNAPKFGNSRPREAREGENNNVLGKRRHDGERKFPHRRRESPGSDTDDSVRRIPMPEDTPPPIPREFRRHNGTHHDRSQQGPPDQPHHLPSKPAPVVESKTTYSSAPQLRDLKKEAVSRFVPDVVRRKQDAVKGGPSGRLLEPEELDRLEAEGYKTTLQPQSAQQQQQQQQPEASQQQVDHSTTISPLDQIQARRLAEEERRFLAELDKQDDGADDSVAVDHAEASSVVTGHGRPVQMEEVDDEDA